MINIDLCCAAFSYMVSLPNFFGSKFASTQDYPPFPCLYFYFSLFTPSPCKTVAFAQSHLRLPLMLLLPDLYNQGGITVSNKTKKLTI